MARVWRRWWWWQVVVAVACSRVPSVVPHPAQQEEGGRWSGAVVEVTLNDDHATSDTHGHAHNRVTAQDSVLKITMEEKLYRFLLTPSSHLVIPGATLSRSGTGGALEHSPLLPRPCLYLVHPDPQGAEGPRGTVSLCHKDGPRVLLMNEKEFAELVPRPSLRPLTPTAHKRGSGDYTHIVKRHPLPAVQDQDCHDYDTCGRSPFPVPLDVPDISQVLVDPTIEEKRTSSGGGGGGGGKGAAEPLMVELGVFLDQALMETFSRYLLPDQELVDLVLGLINNVQALYRHPSLGREVDLTITHLRLLTQQPKDLPTHKGDRVKLLKSFCAYNQKHNDPDDASLNHWDIGVYISGLNFVVENTDGSSVGVTMGLAYTGGACKANVSCVINELGTVNYRGHPYPSSGALSSYVLAHEIGHSLGLRHDGVSNACNSSGYIMAAGRGLRGATTWSPCARDKILLQQRACLLERNTGAAATTWDHNKFRGLPGQRWDATAQCQLFLRDVDARMPDLSRISEVCTTVTCVSPHLISTYLAGPALEGTHCGGRNWCRGGECVPWGAEGPGEVVAGGWGPWQAEQCTSGCVEGATGYQVSRRVCDSPLAVNSVAGCVGSEVRRSLCPDDKVCSKQPRKTVNQLASELCQVVSTLKPTIEAIGRQLSYSADTPWQACALYCQKKNQTSFWTPRYEFKDMPQVATHLPDGTPCHSDLFVCLNRECVPKNAAVTGRAGRSMALTPEDSLLNVDPSSTDYLPMDVDNLFY